ncbi:unnamed protein product [Blepharisma stoltei]|uniref:Uncharacterized protein n=1 Tax=Blepharisma stoltei TaxID=1481888 RepID=A0AAU9IXH5_9CILI|nr:unnamed protein product [Blepharisma stoltei]
MDTINSTYSMEDKISIDSIDGNVTEKSPSLANQCLSESQTHNLETTKAESVHRTLVSILVNENKSIKSFSHSSSPKVEKRKSACLNCNVF